MFCLNYVCRAGIFCIWDGCVGVLIVVTYFRMLGVCFYVVVFSYPRRVVVVHSVCVGFDIVVLFCLWIWMPYL